MFHFAALVLHALLLIKLFGCVHLLRQWLYQWLAEGNITFAQLIPLLLIKAFLSLSWCTIIMPSFSSMVKQAYCVCLFCLRKLTEIAAGCFRWISIKASLNVGLASFNWKENCLAFIGNLPWGGIWSKWGYRSVTTPSVCASRTALTTDCVTNTLLEPALSSRVKSLEVLLIYCMCYYSTPTRILYV